MALPLLQPMGATGLTAEDGRQARLPGEQQGSCRGPHLVYTRHAPRRPVSGRLQSLDVPSLVSLPSWKPEHDLLCWEGSVSSGLGWSTVSRGWGRGHVDEEWPLTPAHVCAPSVKGLTTSKADSSECLQAYF